MTKKCPKCGETKPITDFGVRRSTSDGLSSWCKPCKRKADKSLRATDESRERHRIADRAYFARNREQIIGAWRGLPTSEAEKRFMTEVQAETGKHATKAHRPWTTEDIEAVAVEGVPLKDLALQLGRTYRSVSRMRQRIAADQAPRIAGDT